MSFSFLVRDEQVNMYNEVKGYSSDEIYLKTLEKAYKCLKKVLISGVIFLVIGSVLSVCAVCCIYRHSGKLFTNMWVNAVVSLCLYLCIFIVIVLLVVLLGIVIAERFFSADELDFLNGVFREHAICSKSSNMDRIVVNSSGVFFVASGGNLTKITDFTSDNLSVSLEEYYTISSLCILSRIREYRVYAEDKFIGSIKEDVE